MIRVFGTLVLAGLISSTAFGDEWTSEEMLAIQGIGSVIAAAHQCGFEIDETALNKYMENRGLLSPEALAVINLQVSISRDEDFTPAQCSIHRGLAESIGAAKD